MHVVTCGHLLQDAYTMMPMHADICRYWDHAYLATRSGAIMKASNQANTQAKSGVSGEQRTNLPMCPDVLCLNEVSKQTLMQSQARILYHSELRNMNQLVRLVHQGKINARMLPWGQALGRHV